MAVNDIVSLALLGKLTLFLYLYSADLYVCPTLMTVPLHIDCFSVGFFPTLSMITMSLALYHMNVPPLVEACLQNFAGGLILAAGLSMLVSAPLYYYIAVRN